MHRQHHDEAQQAQHHPLGHPLQAALEAQGAHQEARRHRHRHPDGHLHGVGPHGGEHPVHRLQGYSLESAPGEFEEVAQHPAGHGGVVHHQQIAPDHAEPAVDVPLGACGLQRPVALHRAFAAGPAHRQLHGEHRHPHNHQEQQVEQHEHAAAVFPGDIGEFPHVANADGASGAHQQETQPGAEVFSFHLPSPLCKFPPLYRRTGQMSNFTV